MKITRNPGTAAWAFSSNLHMRNLVFESQKEILTMANTFPELISGVERDL